MTQSSRIKALIPFATLLLGAVITFAVMQLQPATAAVSTAPLPRERVIKLLDSASPGQYEIDKILPATTQGMTGVVIKAKNQRFIAWIPPSADSLIVGALFNAKGENQTIVALQANDVSPGEPTSAPEPVKRGELIDSVAQAEGITQGSGGPTVHAFIDLNCGFCAQLHEQLTPLVAQGQLTVHWIPVAILDASSADLAAEIMQAPPGQNSARLDAHHRARLAGVQPSQKTKIALAANTELLRVVNGAPATPVLIFKGRDGKVYSHAGVLKSAADVLTAGS
jgi:protein-disulfide isomerase